MLERADALYPPGCLLDTAVCTCSCSGSLPSENHLRYRRAVRALRCPPFTVCSAAQTKSLASPQSHATKTRGHHCSKPGHQITSAKPQITSSPLGCIGVPERKRGNSVVGNETKADSAVNVTSLSTAGEEEKIEEVSQFTSIPQEVGSGMQDEVFSPTPGTPTSSEGATSTVASPEISPDSAETDHLIPHGAVNTSEEEEQEVREDVRQLVPTQPPWQDPKVDTVVDLDDETSPTTPSQTHPPSPSDVTVDFFDSGSRRKNLEPPSLSPHELQGRDPTSWAMPNNYDYMTPYDESAPPTNDDYSYSSTTESFEEEVSTTPPPKRFPPQVPSNPGFTFPKGATVEEDPRAPPGVIDSVNGSDCRQGFVRTNGTCKSPCDLQPNYCFNGGQCYVLEGTQLLCSHWVITIGGLRVRAFSIWDHPYTTPGIRQGIKWAAASQSPVN
ncbi:Chondroitin sulfate proteoglycan 5 [Anabarilius grahami]|uniref:Chondroitin sulfate proteoglycan 5 n=1 Tax=Anabarilius grahami TaxID=495550 RepID=A0A3N0Y5K1_ANAGA|nr:Chondroitin sulfate proteoglycan 5 [Anabarilius grahami]